MCMYTCMHEGEYICVCVYIYIHIYMCVCVQLIQTIKQCNYTIIISQYCYPIFLISVCSVLSPYSKKILKVGLVGQQNF